MEDFIMPVASDHDPRTEWQLQITQAPPSITIFPSDRLDETSLLLTGANFDVESNAGQPWMDDYRQSLNEMVFERETTVQHLSIASSHQENGFSHPGEVSLAANNSIRNFGHSEMCLDNADGWRSASDHRTPPPTFSFQRDGTPSDRQQLDAGQGSNDWYHNPPFRQTGPGTDHFTNQFVAGNMEYLPGEPHQHADSFNGNKLRSHDPNMYDQSGGNSAHPPPWSPLELHAAQNMAPSCPTCTFSASSSRGPTATHCSCSLLSYTGTPINTPSSAYTGVVESFDTARAAVSGGDMNQSSQYGMDSFGRGSSGVHGTQDGFHMPEAQAGLLSPHLDAGRIQRLVPLTAIEINSI